MLLPRSRYTATILLGPLRSTAQDHVPSAHWGTQRHWFKLLQLHFLGHWTELEEGLRIQDTLWVVITRLA